MAVCRYTACPIVLRRFQVRSPILVNRNKDDMELQNSVQREIDQQFLDDVICGLAKQQKCLPSKYFYDRRGSLLFDEICELEEYYPTRTEIDIMRRHAKEMAKCIDSSKILVEFGSGSSIKTDYLLSHLRNLSTYVPVDISAEHLSEVGTNLKERYPHLDIQPLADDFTQLDSLPSELQLAGDCSVYFPGSTIGNFHVEEAELLLSNICQIIKPHGAVLLGADLVKDVEILEAAYNDSRRVTAEFNLNILQRINSELGGNVDLDSFEHTAFWNQNESRIEMHLRSLREQTITISGNEFGFKRGETVLTEYSHKYQISDIEQLAETAGMELKQCWTDDKHWFAVVCLVPTD